MSQYVIIRNGIEKYASKEESLEIEARNAAYLAGANDRAAAEIRTERDAKLTQSDWTQVVDAPVDQAAWSTYRQALRDIPTHANFPNLTETDWPTKPE